MNENGNTLPSRIERIEQLMEVLLTRHLEFEDEHKKLLTAQVLLADSLRTVAEQQKHTDEKLNALIAVVDDIVRGRPPAAP